MITTKENQVNNMRESCLTYWSWLRLVFSLFSLYLLGDVFYRWDAFSFHSTLSAYLPNVALAFILWSIVGLLISILVWLPTKAVERASSHLGLQIKTENIILYLFVVALITVTAWIFKKLIWVDLKTSSQIKLTVLTIIFSAAIPLTWRLRDKVGSWVNAIQERITPLTWLFTICLIISLLTVGYKILDNMSSGTISKKITQSTMPGPDKNQPNILLVTFDALTAENMSVYSYTRNTTPFIKKWAESASVFKKAEAESSYTAATTPSLMTGKRTWTHRKYHHDIAAKPFKSKTENLPLVLKENGYNTYAFIANSVAQAKALGIDDSLDYAPIYIELSNPVSIEGIIDKYLYLLFSDKFSTYNWLGQDDFIFTVALRRIDKKIFTTELSPSLAFNKFLYMMDHNSPAKPFFAWIHVMAPHSPYLPPEPFLGTFNPSWELREKNEMLVINPEINKYKNLTQPNKPFPEPLKEKIKLLYDYYDEFILYCDKQFEEFTAELEKRKLSDNTVIMISADHGESFYQHNYFQHGEPHLYEQVTHIPLIIKSPGQTQGQVFDDIVEQIDIPATILGFAQISVPVWMEGRSLLPTIQGKELPSKSGISVSLYRNIPTEPITSAGTIAIWEGDYKLIHFLKSGVSLLFNLKTDPQELVNLIDTEPAMGHKLLKLLNEHLDEANKKIMAEK